MHVDLDCFYASVEVRDNPAYKGHPVIIGANPKQGELRGVVLTCSYEARDYGLHSAMPISKAYQLCPHGIYVHPRMERYVEVSKQVMTILKEMTPVFQAAGIDEAYLDVSEQCSNLDDGRQLADEIREMIQQEIGITCSVGVAPTKTLAKIASDVRKPNGTTVVGSLPGEIQQFLAPMIITKIPGIGKKSRQFFNKKGFHTIKDFYAHELPQLAMTLGRRTANWIWKVIHGEDDRPVNEFHKRNSVGKERTFHQDTVDRATIAQSLSNLNARIHEKLVQGDLYYRTVTLKIRFYGFETHTRSHSFPTRTRDSHKAMKAILSLLEEFARNKRKVRLIGVRFTNLSTGTKGSQTKLLRFFPELDA